MPYKDKERGRQQHKEYMRGWYKRNKDKHQVYVNNRRIKYKKKLHPFIDWIKIQIGCCECGFNKDAVALDFHHVNGYKTIDIGRAVSNTWNISKIQKEMTKCKILCSNCHRIEHKQQRKGMGERPSPRPS